MVSDIYGMQGDVSCSISSISVYLPPPSVPPPYHCWPVRTPQQWRWTPGQSPSSRRSPWAAPLEAVHVLPPTAPGYQSPGPAWLCGSCSTSLDKSPEPPCDPNGTEVWSTRGRSLFHLHPQTPDNSSFHELLCINNLQEDFPTTYVHVVTSREWNVVPDPAKRCSNPLKALSIREGMPGKIYTLRTLTWGKKIEKSGIMILCGFFPTLMRSSNQMWQSVIW